MLNSIIAADSLLIIGYSYLSLFSISLVILLLMNDHRLLNLCCHIVIITIYRSHLVPKFLCSSAPILRLRIINVSFIYLFNVDPMAEGVDLSYLVYLGLTEKQSRFEFVKLMSVVLPIIDVAFAAAPQAVYYDLQEFAYGPLNDLYVA